MAEEEEKLGEGDKTITIHQIIAAVSPDLYYDYGGKKEKLDTMKKLVKEKGAYLAIKDLQGRGEKVKPQAIRYALKDKMYFKLDKSGSESKHTLVYDSSSEQLEPIYFFILDLMNSFHLGVEKLTDNFTSSPGSGHFGDLGQRATIMQQQASRMMGDINNVMRSILNLVYDLKDFQIRIQTYKDLKSEDSAKKESALLALKQIWMDKVDINKGNSSIKAMAFSSGGQMGFQTLVDAFLFVKDEKSVDTVDLNDRVKRIIKQRIHEFNLWLTESEKELTKRYEMERKYLKSQVNSVKLYSRWAKPYLKSAHQLEMKDNSKNPDLVKTFNTLLLELTLLGTSKIDIQGSVEEIKLPKEFAKMKLKRDYMGIIVVDFKFRGIPQKTNPYQQHYVFGGKSTVTFTAYALNSEELKKVKEEVEKADIGDALSLIEGATTGSLDEMQKEIDMFLKEETEAEKKAEKKLQKDTSNPFLALLGFYNSKDKSSPVGEAKKEEKSESIKPDTYLEKEYLRPLASENITETTYTIFDIYKKAHGMASFT